MTSRRAVVTGLGTVSPVGIGADASWEALISGQSGIADITAFDTTGYDIHIAGEVKGFDATATRTWRWPPPARRCGMPGC